MIPKLESKTLGGFLFPAFRKIEYNNMYLFHTSLMSFSLWIPINEARI